MMTIERDDSDYKHVKIFKNFSAFALTKDYLEITLRQFYEAGFKRGYYYGGMKGDDTGIDPDNSDVCFDTYNQEDTNDDN